MNKFKLTRYCLPLCMMLVFAAFAREITDDNGKTCHTVKIDQNMVEFVMIRGESVLLYKDGYMREPVMTLKNKTFAQYLDREGRSIKIRVYDGLNAPTDGWVTRFQVYENRGGVTTIFYGEPFPFEESGEIRVQDIELDQIAWIVKDQTKLYYEPSHESDYKYEIYFGLRLEVKRQRGDFYFVMIYNSILREYRPGWVKIEDTGTFEYFVKEYERRKNEYQKDINVLDKSIAEQANILNRTGSDLAALEKKRDLLYSSKYQRLQRIDDLKVRRRERMNEEERRRNDKIEELKAGIAELHELKNSLSDEIGVIERGLQRISDGIAKDEKAMDDYRALIDDLKAGRIKPEQAMAEVIAAKGELSVIEGHFSKEIVTVSEEEQCSDIRIELESKQTDFEEIRQKMSGPVTREEYDVYYEEYLRLWAEMGELKKDLAKCEIYAHNRHIALYNEALGLKKNYDLDGALELLMEAVDVKNDFDEGYYQIVLILISLDEDSTISKYIDKISDPERKGLLYNRRASAARDRFPDRAIKYYEEMAKIYKPDLAFYSIGIIHIEKYGNLENGIRHLKRALEINYEDPRTLEALGAAHMDLKPQKGQNREQLVIQAADYFEKAYRNAGGYRNIDVLCVRLSQAYNVLGRATSALKYADLALQHTRQNPFGAAHLEKAKALIKMERKQEALKHLKEAARDLSAKTEAEYWIGQIEN